MNKRIAFVTGASSDIGRSIVRHLTETGWRVICPSHTELDLADLDAVAVYAENLKNNTDKVGVFVHVAGIWHDSDQVLADKPFATFKASQISEAMNVGVISAMILTCALLQNEQFSSVIGISGTFNSGAKGWLPYYASKRALEDFLLGLSQDQDALKVYGISPADTATKAYGKFYPEYMSEAQSPDSIAELALRLLEGDEKYVSGTIIEVRDGKPSEGFHS
ncbi:MAG TPA: SDR family oxidoreductase [Candidatus Saccharimonadia bacterium]|nr:SDR family oxidoreductase [Candidatus Saccharimonadia bacterium]